MNEDVQKVLEENEVDKISFYYVGSPIVNNAFTTCVLISSSRNRIEARGVSICSLVDSFNKQEGKNRAFGRAIRALTRRENIWKINGTGRDEEFVKRGIKIKTKEDELYFRNEIIEELKQIDPQMMVSQTSSGQYKKYVFDVPLSYPVRLANSLYKYKSQYRPTPSGTQEQDLLKKLTIFTEPIINLISVHHHGDEI